MLYIRVPVYSDATLERICFLLSEFKPHIAGIVLVNVELMQTHLLSNSVCSIIDTLVFKKSINALEDTSLKLVVLKSVIKAGNEKMNPANATSKKQMHVDRQIAM